jgi:hypothetical protein
MPRIFMSYRRADSMAVSGRIYDHLVEVFGEDSVFKDVENIEAGDDFRVVLTNAVSSCDVLLVIIGPNWLNVADSTGRRRLEDPHDFVRLEVETGLKRSDVLVVPLLIENASMPRPSDLPASMQDLCFRNAMPVRNDPDFHRDIQILLDHLHRYFKRLGRERRRLTPMILGVVAALIVIAAGAFFLLNGQPGFLATATATPTEVAIVPTDTQTPTEIPPTPTPEPSATPTEEATPEVQAPVEPTVLYPEGKALQLLYNASSFYAYNPDGQRLPVEDLSFVALDATGERTNYRFSGLDWTAFYRFIDRGACSRLEIVMAQPFLRPSECRNYNASVNPRTTDSEVFWITRDNVTQFAVLWNREEIARCETAAESCTVYLPA